MEGGTLRRLYVQLRPSERGTETKVDDYYHDGERRRLRLHEKGGKEHEMPVHHLLEQILNEYVEAGGLRSGQPLYDRTKDEITLSEVELIRP